jgi:drug/metabolite transporter (DMT)-like permease
MIVGIIMALLSAICYGLGSALQAKSASVEADTGGVDARLLVRLAKRGPFALGMVLDVVGFVAQFVSLRYLAVFVVQAVQAGNLAVTALAAVPLLGSRLRGREWAAVAAVCVGLVLLAVAAGTERADPVHGSVRWSLLIGAVALTVLGAAVGRITARWSPIALGGVAGLGFGVLALAARVLTDLSPAHLVRDPAAYALLLGGFVSFLLYATALQRGTVTIVTAAVVIGETVLPAVIGIVVLGDRTRPGFVPVAAAGFAVAVAGALMLARFGEGGAPPASLHPAPAAG